MADKGYVEVKSKQVQVSISVAEIKTRFTVLSTTVVAPLIITLSKLEFLFKAKVIVRQINITRLLIGGKGRKCTDYKTMHCLHA